MKISQSMRRVISSPVSLELARAIGVIGLLTLRLIANGELIELAPYTVVGTHAIVESRDKATLNDLIVSPDLLAEGYSAVGDYLNQLPGVYYNVAPGGAGGSELSLRGGESNVTTITLYGVKVNDVLDERGGTFDPGLISPVLISSLQVQHGPSSTFLGSGALSGVVSLETMVPREASGGRMHVSLGKNENASIALAADLVEGETLWHFDGGWRSEEVVRSQSERTIRQVGLGLRHWLTDETEIIIAARHLEHDARAFPSDSGGVLYAQRDAREYRETALDMGSMRLRRAVGLNGRWQLSGYAFRQEADHDSPGVFPGVRDPFGLPATASEAEFMRYGMNFDYAATPVSGLDVGFGVGVEREAGHTATIYDFGPYTLPAYFSIGRTIYSIRGETHWTHGSWSVYYALRLDSADKEDSSSLSHLLRLDRQVFPLEGLSIGLSAKSAFKYASLFALSNPLVGNPSLLPEEATTFAVHLRYSASRSLLLEATFFSSRYMDLIDFDAGPPPRLVNRDQVVGKGFDLNAHWSRGRFALNGFLSLAKTSVKGSDAELLGRPEWRAGATLKWQLAQKWTMHLRGSYHSSRLASSIPTGDQKLAGFTQADAVLIWKWRENSQWQLALRNLFDTSFQTAIGVPADGFNMALRHTVRW